MCFKKLSLSLVVGASLCVLAYASPAANVANPNPNLMASVQTTKMTQAAIPTTTQQFNVVVTVVNSGPGRPSIAVNLSSPAQVQITQGATVLYSASLPAGLTYVGTDSFPAGSYVVTVSAQAGKVTLNSVENLDLQ